LQRGDSAASASPRLRTPLVSPRPEIAAIKQTKSKGGRIVAIGTTVVRAIESAASADGSVLAGHGVARERIARATRLRIVEAILTGVHEPGESHFELLRAFANDTMLDQTYEALLKLDYRTHEFGDSMLIERQCARQKGKCENSR
jgi:S-adenosylmethionine:tRNA ribosyltransferase-isomerase